MMSRNEVILVDDQDRQVGTMDKMEAHRKGLLHRAFSIFIFNSKGDMLLQQRAKDKYHGGLLWTNACCSHPYPGEQVEAAAARRLKEEMGFVTELEKLSSFTYRAKVENDLTEHEFDHVFTGTYEGKINPDPDEVNDYKFMSMDDIRSAVEKNPEDFTTWFRIALGRIKELER